MEREEEIEAMIEIMTKGHKEYCIDQCCYACEFHLKYLQYDCMKVMYAETLYDAGLRFVNPPPTKQDED